MERGDIAIAFQLFDLAFDMVRDFLNLESLTLLPCLYLILRPSGWVRRQEGISRLLGFVNQMGQTRFPPHHPLQRSINISHHTLVEDRVKFLKCLHQSIMKLF